MNLTTKNAAQNKLSDSLRSWIIYFVWPFKCPTVDQRATPSWRLWFTAWALLVKFAASLAMGYWGTGRSTVFPLWVAVRGLVVGSNFLLLAWKLGGIGDRQLAVVSWLLLWSCGFVRFRRAAELRPAL